jgi:rhodanese-related sulfurtransferase
MRAYCWACILASTLMFGIACGQAPKAAESKTLSPDELAKYLEQPDKVFFLDVRTTEEISKLGSVKGYKHIPVSELEGRLNEVPKDKLIVTL